MLSPVANRHRHDLQGDFARRAGDFARDLTLLIRLKNGIIICVV